jgi:hypothetical protein
MYRPTLVIRFPKYILRWPLAALLAINSLLMDLYSQYLWPLVGLVGLPIFWGGLVLALVLSAYSFMRWLWRKKRWLWAPLSLVSLARR